MDVGTYLMSEEHDAEGRPPASEGSMTSGNFEVPSVEHSGTFRLATELKLDADRIDRHLVSLLDPASMEAESYRRLRYSVEAASTGKQGTAFAICSPAPGDGKTVTSINLAGAMAQDPDARVILLELDLRKPSSSVANYLGIDDEDIRPGLVEKVRDPSLLWGDVVRYLPEFNLHVMASGQRTSRPYEILKSRRLATLIAEARQRYDYVVVDTPPIVLMPDSQLISQWVDGIIVVVTGGVTSRHYLAETLDLLEPEKVSGLVFNDRHPGFMKGYYEYAYPELHQQTKGSIGRLKSLFRPGHGKGMPGGLR